MSSGVHVLGVSVWGVSVWGVSVRGGGGWGGGGLCPEQDIITLKKAASNNIQGLFQGFITLIINIEEKYVFFVHFWHQSFIALVLDISILTLDMSVNNTSNSSIFHILLFHELELGQVFNLKTTLVGFPLKSCCNLKPTKIQRWNCVRFST